MGLYRRNLGIIMGLIWVIHLLDPLRLCSRHSQVSSIGYIQSKIGLQAQGFHARGLGFKAQPSKKVHCTIESRQSTCLCHSRVLSVAYSVLFWVRPGQVLHTTRLELIS